MNEFVEALKQKREEYNLTLEEMVPLLNAKYNPMVAMYLTEKRPFHEYQYELFLNNLETLINTEKMLEDVIKSHE